jgi:hypothetical protein
MACAKIDTPALIPWLNHLGSEGCELVSIEPQVVGRNADVKKFDNSAQGGKNLTHIYLCVFKRRTIG